VPDKLDGTTLVVNVPAAAVLEYGTGKEHGGALVVGEAGTLTVSTEGQGSLEELRSYLLGLPDLPPDVVQQLRTINSWTNTLPVPIPADRIQWTRATLAGHDGLLLNDNSGVGSAAMWEADDHLFGVAGSMKADELKRVADSFR
jgi:hypothetical protein